MQVPQRAGAAASSRLTWHVRMEDAVSDAVSAFSRLSPSNIPPSKAPFKASTLERSDSQLSFSSLFDSPAEDEPALSPTMSPVSSPLAAPPAFAESPPSESPASDLLPPLDNCGTPPATSQSLQTAARCRAPTHPAAVAIPIPNEAADGGEPSLPSYLRLMVARHESLLQTRHRGESGSLGSLGALSPIRPAKASRLLMPMATSQ